MAIHTTFHQKKSSVAQDGTLLSEPYDQPEVIESRHRSPMGTLYLVRFSASNAQLMDEESVCRFTGQTAQELGFSSLPYRYGI